MGSPGGDAGESDACGHGDGGRCCSACRGAVTELPEGVVPPAVCGTSCCERARVVVTGGDAGEGDANGHGDRDRCCAVCCGAVTQSPAGIVPPAVCGTSCGERARVDVTGGDAGERDFANNSGRCCAVCRGAVTELPVPVESPGICRGSGCLSGGRHDSEARDQSDDGDKDNQAMCALTWECYRILQLA